MKIGTQRAIGAIVLGGLALAAGIYVQQQPAFHPYGRADNVAIDKYIVGSNLNGFRDYFSVQGSSLLFFANEEDFTPRLDVRQLSAFVSFVFQSTPLASNIDITGSNGTELKAAQAYEVEEITSISNGNTFATRVYEANPNGVQQDPTGAAYALYGFAAFNVLLALFLPMRPGMRAGVTGRILGLYAFVAGAAMTVLSVTYFLNSFGVASIPVTLDKHADAGTVLILLIFFASLVPVGLLIFLGRIGWGNVEAVDF
ncbi:MAG TPA: hypothetical protein VH349_04295 [Ktedonobacterales bacterium]|jgi:hypothetical protein